MQMRRFIKNILTHSPVAITRNEYYDRLTEKVIRNVCGRDSVCIDAGANEGRVLSMFIRHCPEAVHYAFEPIPYLFHQLKRRYSSAAKIYELALSDTETTSSFNHVVTDPAYSGLKKRKYDKPEVAENIYVKTTTLDAVVPASESVRLIKLDIEGGEYHALLGATRLLKCSPYLLFEFGKGGSEAYDVTPAMMFHFLKNCNYRINTLARFLKGAAPLSLPAFEYYYTTSKAYFFIAYAS